LLKLNDEDFTSGRAKFLDKPPGDGEATAKIYVRIKVGGWDYPIFAQLDTGSPWSILASEVAAEMGLLNGQGVAKTLITRHGDKHGHLVTLPLTIPADEGEGESLDIANATFFVCKGWPNQSFLGYSGLIDAIRIGLDAQQYYFYFGTDA
jgi:hypothetical protein